MGSATMVSVRQQWFPLGNNGFASARFGNATMVTQQWVRQQWVRLDNNGSRSATMYLVRQGSATIGLVTQQWGLVTQQWVRQQSVRFGADRSQALPEPPRCVPEHVLIQDGRHAHFFCLQLGARRLMTPHSVT